MHNNGCSYAKKLLKVGLVSRLYDNTDKDLSLLLNKFSLIITTKLETYFSGKVFTQNHVTGYLQVYPT